MRWMRHYLLRQKFNFFFFLPKAMSSDPCPRTPKKKMMMTMTMMKKKKTPGTTVILRRASTRINNNGSFRFKEPRSPKVSCIGNVGRNKNQKKKKRKDDSVGKEQSNTAAISPPNSSLILKLFLVFKKKGTKLAANPYAESSSQPSAVSKRSSVPKLVQPKKYSGSRGGLSCFDWRVRDSSAVAAPYRPSSLPSKREKRKDVIVVENIELIPRKEINLWKKRMVSPPPPLLV